MSIQEKIQARLSQRQHEDVISKAIRKAFIRIGGTVIGFILRRLIYG